MRAPERREANVGSHSLPVMVRHQEVLFTGLAEATTGITCARTVIRLRSEKTMNHAVIHSTRRSASSTLHAKHVTVPDRDTRVGDVIQHSCGKCFGATTDLKLSS